MKIGVLGAKVIGGTLGRKWAQAGHTVRFGVRAVDNAAVQTMAQELGATVGTVEEAIAFGEVILFAIPGNAMEETIRAQGPALAGKIVMDAANRMGGGPMNSTAAFAAHVTADQQAGESGEMPLERVMQPNVFKRSVPLQYSRFSRIFFGRLPKFAYPRFHVTFGTH